MSADRWGSKQEAQVMTPAQYKAMWTKFVRTLCAGELMQTPGGIYYARCGRRLDVGFCYRRINHSAACSPIWNNACDASITLETRCVLHVGHKSKCMAHFPRSKP
jgi:hypothetical protein